MKTFVKLYLNCGEMATIRISGQPKLRIQDLEWGRGYGLVVIGEGLYDKHHWSAKGPIFMPTYMRSCVGAGLGRDCFVAIEPYLWFMNADKNVIKSNYDACCNRLVIETRDGNKCEKLCDLQINPETKIDGWDSENGVLYSNKEWKVD